jgi:hypothetical protein
VTSAAKAGVENKPFIAAVNRCATQKPNFFRKLLGVKLEAHGPSYF